MSLDVFGLYTPESSYIEKGGVKREEEEGPWICCTTMMKIAMIIEC